MASRNIDIQCWKCGTELKELLMPFSRYEECSYCKADLHVCIACRSYNPSLSNACNEDRADFVLDKDKANFCDFFHVNARSYQKQDNSEAKEARAKLAELFGENSPEEKLESKQSCPETEAERALAELKRLFGDEE